jgi:hypothetical protein
MALMTITHVPQRLALVAFSGEFLSSDEEPKFPLAPLCRDGILTIARNRRLLPMIDTDVGLRECEYPLGMSNRALVNALYCDLLGERPLCHIGLMRFLVAASRAVVELIREVAQSDYRVEVPNDSGASTPFEHLALEQSLAGACNQRAEDRAQVLSRLKAFEDFEAKSPGTEEGTLYLLVVYGGRIVEELASYWPERADEIEGCVSAFAQQLHDQASRPNACGASA